VAVSHGPLDVPVLSDGIVLLRPFTAEDAGVLVEIWQDAEIQQRNSLPAALTPDAARAWVADKLALARDGLAWEWAITDAVTGELAGRRAIKELNWHDCRAVCSVFVAAKFRGRRFAARSLRLAAAHAFDSGMRRVQADCEADNIASIRSVIAAGMRHEGTLRDYFRANDGRQVTAETFSLLPTDLASAPPL
jgi:ribosomal-protein-alanine N-acetyltransferase